MQPPNLPPVIDNTEASRFEIRLGDYLASLDYALVGRRMLIVHTEVPPALEGRGLGGHLARAALDHARAAGLRVEARCPFVRSYLERHAEYSDLVDR